MLVLSREVGSTIMIVPDPATVSVTIHVTVEKLQSKTGTAWFSVRHTTPTADSESEPMELTAAEPVGLWPEVTLTLVDVGDEKVRLGITAPKEMAVHRLEVYEMIQRESRAARGKRPFDEPDNGLAGSPVPKAPRPKPPSLNDRLREPNPPATGSA